MKKIIKVGLLISIISTTPYMFSSEESTIASRFKAKFDKEKKTKEIVLKNLNGSNKTNCRRPDRKERLGFEVELLEKFKLNNVNVSDVSIFNLSKKCKYQILVTNTKKKEKLLINKIKYIINNKIEKLRRKLTLKNEQ